MKIVGTCSERDRESKRRRAERKGIMECVLGNRSKLKSMM